MRSNANHHEPTLNLDMPAAYADIALRLALPGSLQFGIPESLRGSLRIGQRVMVPLRGGRDVGYVVGLSSEPKVRGIRPIERVLDPEPQLPPDLLELMLWIAHHYLSPIGMVLRAAVPQSVHYEGTGKAVARERQILTAALDHARRGGRSAAPRPRSPRPRAGRGAGRALPGAGQAGPGVLLQPRRPRGAAEEGARDPRQHRLAPRHPPPARRLGGTRAADPRANGGLFADSPGPRRRRASRCWCRASPAAARPSSTCARSAPCPPTGRPCCSSPKSR